MRRTFALPLAAVAAFAAVFPASTRADDPPEEARIRIVIPDEGISVPDLLMALSTQTRTPISWSREDKSLVGARIVRSQPIVGPATWLWEIVRGLLIAKEVVLVPVGPKHSTTWHAVNVRELVSSVTLKMKPDWVEIDDANVEQYANQDGLFVTTTISVENMENLRDARTALQRMITANNIGSVQEVPDARCFVVTDFAPNVMAIWKLVRQMDAGAKKPVPTVQYVALAKARAEKMVGVLWDLFPTGRPPADAKGPTPSDPRALKIVADPWTNQIVLSGTPSDVDAVRAVIAKLDLPQAPPPSDAKPAGEPSTPGPR